MTTPAPQTAIDKRPAVAIIANSQTPYRLHLHQRIARECPTLKLYSLFTHDLSNADWAFAASDEIGAVQFGQGESSADQGRLRYAWREWRRAGQIIRWLKSHRARAVVMMGYNDAGRLRLMRWCHQNEISCFLFGDSNVLGDTARGLKRIVKNRVVRQVVSWCTGILCCGSLGRDYFLRYGADPNRIFYFPYEPDYQLIQNLPAGVIDAVRKRFKLDPARRRLVFSGRLALVKRPDTLIKAFNAVAPLRPDWDLVMVGHGSLEAPLKAMLSQDLQSRVTWTGFIDDQATVSAIYRCCDCLVLPSEFEPWALVINEAAAARLAIISSNVVGAARELVRPGVNGELFPPGDAIALQAALLKVTDSENIDRFRNASASVLTDWRERGDPVLGLRKALSLANLVT